MTKDFESLSKKELIQLAKKKAIKMPYLYRKEELIRLIKRAENPSYPRFVKPRGRAANRFSRRSRSVRKAKGKIAANVKPYDEPTYHEETLQPVQLAQKKVFHSEAQSSLSREEELPYSYDETKVVLMVRDPYWAFTYWDMSSSTARKVSALLKEHYGNIKSILRVYDVTDVDFNGKNAHRSFDVDVFLEARNWYLNLGTPNRSYLVDLGLLDAQSNFYLVARSNVVKTPRDGPSDVVDEEWRAVDFEELYALSGGLGIGLSSQDLRQKRKELFEQILSSPGSSFSSGAISGSALSKDKEKDFFLQVATELVVYGRTLPDAKVTVSGESVRLRPDGTFSSRYFFPDGEKSLPIQAVSQDEDRVRKVSILVKKETASE